MKQMTRLMKAWIRRLRKQTKERSGGFTFVELMIVVAIIGILAAIAVPQFSKATAKAEEAQAIANTKVLSQAAQMYYIDAHQTGEVAISTLKSGGYLDIDEKKTKDLSKYHVRIAEDGKVSVTVDGESVASEETEE